MPVAIHNVPYPSADPAARSRPDREWGRTPPPGHRHAIRAAPLVALRHSSAHAPWTATRAARVLQATGALPRTRCHRRIPSTVARSHLPDLRRRSSLAHSRRPPRRHRPSRPADFRGAAQAAARPREGWGGVGGGRLGRLPCRPGRRATWGPRGLCFSEFPIWHMLFVGMMSMLSRKVLIIFVVI